MFAGQLLGSLFWGPFADAFGRRICYLFSSSIITISGWASGFAPSYGALLCLRFVVGIGVGGSTVPYDIFAEFLPHSIRGRSLMLTNLFWVFGELYITLAAYLVLPIDGGT